MYQNFEYSRVIGREKRTITAQQRYFAEYEGHKIGNTYTDFNGLGEVQLVLIEKPVYAAVIDEQGIGHTTTLYQLDTLELVENELFPWLTWRAEDKKTFKHGPLSNFWVQMDGLTLEHRFASSKSLDVGVKLSILQAKTPGKAKKMGRNCVCRPDWDMIKGDLMDQLVMEKFFSDDFCREYLLATQNLYLEERNTWNDRVWGVNMKGQGHNKLGLSLMKAREALKDADY